MRRLAIGVACLVGVQLTASPQIPRATAFGVRLVVHVTASGHAVTNLTAQDFEVSDADVLQHVDAARLSDAVSIALLVDTSVSTRGPSFSTVVESSRALVKELTPADRMAVVTVSDHSTLLTPMTSDRATLLSLIGDLPKRPAGFVATTALFDGLLFAASQAAREDGASVVLAVTDGLDNANWSSRRDAARLLQTLGVTVDVVGLPEMGTLQDIPPPGPREFPDDVAKDAGGDYFSAMDKRLSEKLRARLQELRESYIVTYSPRSVRTDDGWHAIKVQVRLAGASVKTRPGYYADRPQARD
jgi:VWFA-related protein